MHDLIDAELRDACRARAMGKEGRARVCARRAAGTALAACFASQGVGMARSSAYGLLRQAGHARRLPQKVRAAALRLTAKVDMDYQLPHPQDPLEDAVAVVNEALSHLG